MSHGSSAIHCQEMTEKKGRLRAHHGRRKGKETSTAPLNRRHYESWDVPGAGVALQRRRLLPRRRPRLDTGSLLQPRGDLHRAAAPRAGLRNANIAKGEKEEPGSTSTGFSLRKKAKAAFPTGS